MLIDGSGIIILMIILEVSLLFTLPYIIETYSGCSFLMGGGVRESLYL
jgi:hypothetical protein